MSWMILRRYEKKTRQKFNPEEIESFFPFDLASHI